MIKKDTRAGIKPLRIAMLCLHSSPFGPLGTRDTGGMSVYVRETARRVARAGHEGDIFTCVPGSAGQQRLWPGGRLIHLASDGAREIPKERLFDHLPEAVQAMVRFAQTATADYDLIHSHYWLSGMAGNMLQKQWRCPHLTMFHTLGLIKNRSAAGEAEPDLRISHERDLAKAVDAIIVPTADEKQNLLTHYAAPADKVCVVPCGVDLECFKPLDKQQARDQLKLDADAEVVLYVGRFAPVKGLNALFNAVAELVPRYPRLQLVVVGGDGDGSGAARSLLRQADALGIGARVALAGRVEHEALVNYYNAADLLALPSAYESFGLVTLEALACGTPVVATAVGGAASIIEEGLNGTIIDHPDSAAVARGLERALIQLRHREFSSRAIRNSVAGFGWDRITGMILRVYDELMRSYVEMSPP